MAALPLYAVEVSESKYTFSCFRLPDKYGNLGLKRSLPSQSYPEQPLILSAEHFTQIKS